MRAASVLAGVAGACLLARCVIFTGSTSGYQLEEAGVVVGCTKAADCADAGICCLVESASSLSAITGSCQSDTCGGPLPIQLCGKNTECTAGSCIKQQCTVGDASTPVKACGVIPTCTTD